VGRLNGPLDNLISSCQSCHGSAQFPRSATFNNYPSAAVDDSGYNQRLADYFRDIAPGQVFDPVTHFLGDTTPVHAISMDYSLQIQTGLEHLCASVKKKEKPPGPSRTPCDGPGSCSRRRPRFGRRADQAGLSRDLCGRKVAAWRGICDFVHRDNKPNFSANRPRRSGSTRLGWEWMDLPLPDPISSGFFRTSRGLPRR
jgi:hypothetical protein